MKRNGTAYHRWELSQSGIRAIKLLKLGDTRNLICWYTIFALLCSVPVTRMSCQPMPPGEPTKLAGVKNTSGHQSCLHAINTSLLQPMDQGVIATFMEMVKVLKRSEKIIKDYWCTFNILKGINNTDTAWDEVSVNYLDGKWCKLLPKIMHDFTCFEPVENTAEDIR